MIASSFETHPTAAHPQEGHLVHQARSGNADAFVQLYDAYVDRVYRYVYFRTANELLAESITPRVFIKSWQLLDRYRTFDSSFLTWLYKIASDQVTDYFASHPAGASRADDFLWSIEDHVFNENVQDMFDLQAMRAALKYLTDDEQHVLILKFIADMSTDNIARIMAKPISAVQALQAHALQVVAGHMDEKQELP
jgi:RNA polymerase sigma-70 factor (ECF subfamily)